MCLKHSFSTVVYCLLGYYFCLCETILCNTCLGTPIFIFFCVVRWLQNVKSEFWLNPKSLKKEFSDFDWTAKLRHISNKIIRAVHHTHLGLFIFNSVELILENSSCILDIECHIVLDIANCILLNFLETNRKKSGQFSISFNESENYGTTNTSNVQWNYKETSSDIIAHRNK